MMWLAGVGGGTWMDTPATAATVYRCPGPPVAYTDNLNAEDARARKCVPLDGLPVFVTQPQRVAPAPSASAQPSANAAAAPATGSPASAKPPSSAVATVNAPEARVNPVDQRGRDAEARRILESELRKEEARLNEALRVSGAGAGNKPASGNPDNRATIQRAEADIEALRRELQRLR